MSEPLSPPPLRKARPEYLPAYVSNGLIGLRCPPIPFLDGTAMVTGFAGIDPNDGVEGFSRVPFPLAADVRVGGIALSQARDQVHLVEQRYDFATAELSTILEYCAAEATAHIEVVTLCSRTMPTIALQKLRVSVDAPVELELTAGCVQLPDTLEKFWSFALSAM